MIVYGLKSCDTTRNALKELKEAGFSPDFSDIREKPLTTEKINIFLSSFGDALVNKRSTTWRSLSVEQRARHVADLLSSHPALMKRPVVESEDERTLGWGADARRRWGVAGET